MPTTKKSKRTVRKTSRPKRKQTGTSRKPTRVSRGTKPRATPKPSHPKTLDGSTFVYECTGLGCGYKIWRDDQDEPGQLRFDLKCPKCHHKVFRCLGKEEVPATFELPPQPSQLEFDAPDTTNLDSNPAI